jgi:hypothetical protein
MTQGLKPVTGVILVDPTTGVPAGLMGADGKEYLLATTANGPGAAAPAAYAPGAVAITGGSVNGTPIGATTPSTGAFSTLKVGTFADQSGSPGNVTNNGTHGRAAFAAAGTAVVVTNSTVAATSTVLVSLGGTDSTLTTVRVTPAAGSFTVTGNAAATATTPFDYVVVN